VHRPWGEGHSGDLSYPTIFFSGRASWAAVLAGPVLCSSSPWPWPWGMSLLFAVCVCCCVWGGGGASSFFSKCLCK